MNQSLFRTARHLITAAALTCSLGVAGCDDSTNLSAELYRATSKINGLSPGGAAPATPEYKAQVFGDVIRSLQTNANSGTASEQAAAYLLIAQAQAGLAENPAGEAAVHQREALNLLTGIEAGLDQWQLHNSSAAAAGSYDPGPALADIDKESRDRDAQMAGERARKAEVDASIAKLLAEAASIAESARARRAAQGEMAAQVSGESAVRGEELIRQAAQIGREADALEAQAADLEAQAAKIAPSSDQIQLTIDRLASQKALLERSRGEVTARAAAYAASAKAAREQAQQDASEIAGLVKQLAEVGAPSEGHASAFERAVQGFTSAVTSAGRAKQAEGARQQAMLTSGAAQHALGDLHWSRAHTLARIIETVDALANARPPLPEASEYSALAARTREQRGAALEAATAAYEAAFNDYQSAGAKGDVQERMDRVRERLGKITKATSGGKLDLLAGMTPSESASTGEEDSKPPAAEGASTQAPKAAIDGMISSLREGRYAELVDSLHVNDPANERVLAALPPLLDASGRLETACQSRFGKGFMQITAEQGAAMAAMFGGQSMPMSAGFEPPSLDELSSDSLTFEVEGDQARVSSQSGDEFSMRLIDGAWRIDLTEFEQMLEGQPDAAKWRELILFMIPQLAGVLDAVAGEVDSGVHAAAENVFPALQARLMSIMPQMVSKMQELGLEMPGMDRPHPPGVPAQPGGGGG